MNDAFPSTGLVSRPRGRGARPFLGCVLLLSACAPRPLLKARPNDADLGGRLAAAVAGFHGEAGVYVRHLRTGQAAAVRADDAFPSASLIKVPILAAFFDSLERGSTDYNSALVYSSSRAYADGDLLASFKDSETVTVGRLVHLTAAFSDNSAALWLQELAGGGVRVNRWLEDHGFKATRVNSRVPGREAAWKEFGWGQTTPREMAELLVMVREGRVVSPAASEAMLRVLSGSFWDGEALSQIPPRAHTASKQGGVDASRSEVVLADGPSGGYVFCVMTRNQADTGWGHDNEGFALIRRVSRILWEHFEGSPYDQPAGSLRYWKKQ